MRGPPVSNARGQGARGGRLRDRCCRRNPAASTFRARAGEARRCRRRPCAGDARPRHRGARPVPGRNESPRLALHHPAPRAGRRGAARRAQSRSCRPDTMPEAAISGGQEERQAMRDVIIAFRRLPAIHREALWVVVVEGLDYAEAAKVLGVPRRHACAPACRGRGRRCGAASGWSRDSGADPSRAAPVAQLSPPAGSAARALPGSAAARSGTGSAVSTRHAVRRDGGAARHRIPVPRPAAARSGRGWAEVAVHGIPNALIGGRFHAGSGRGSGWVGHCGHQGMRGGGSGVASTAV